MEPFTGATNVQLCLQVLPLKWVCLGRRPPEKEVPEQPMDFMSDEEDDEDKDEEKRCVRCFLILCNK